MIYTIAQFERKKNLNFNKEILVFTYIEYVAVAVIVLFVIIMFRFPSIRQVERRVFQFLDAENVQEFESSFFFHRLRAVKVQTTVRMAVPKPTQNIPPPAVQASNVTMSDTVVVSDTFITYYNPENLDPMNPIGIDIPRYLPYVQGKGEAATRKRREVVLVTVAEGGIWYPTVVDRKTNIMYHPKKVPRRWERKGYRNIYYGEFVVKDDLIGIVLDAKKKRDVEVRAPVTGNIVHFAAFPKTSVVKNTLVYLIAASGEVKKLTSQQVGTYTLTSPKQPPVTVLLGKPVPKGTILGYTHALKLHTPIVAPEDCTLVRAFVEEGKPIEHGALLFEYLPTT